MDADSSYGGSDTAHDGTLGQDSNSMDTSHSNPSHDPTNTNSRSSPDSSNYYKNEISLPVNCDEGDFQKNGKTPTLPQYLSTANFNIDATLENHNNLEELNKKYRSSQRLNETPKSSKKDKAGLDNPAYLDDENVKVNNDDTMGYRNGNLNSSPKLGHEDEPQAEAVNLELINLKPNGKDVTGPYENGKGISGIPVKKDNFESGTPYDEYFVPVNEHRKYMSYFPFDTTTRNKGRNSVTFAETTVSSTTGVDDFGLSVTTPERGIVEYPDWLNVQENSRYQHSFISPLIGSGFSTYFKTDSNVLVLVGIIGNPEAHPIEEGRHFGGSSSTDSIKTAGGLFGSNSDGRTMEAEKAPITPSPPSSTVPSLPPTTPKPLSEVTVPRTIQSQFKIDNLQYEPELGNKNSSEFKELAEAIEEELKSILFSRDVLNYGSAEIQLKVLEFSPGSVVVKFRVGWVMKDGVHNAKDPIDRDALEKKLRDALAYNHGYIANYRIADDSVTVETVIDLCKTNNNNGCEYNCSFSYKIEDFICECPEGEYIQEDGKKCGQQHHLTTEHIDHNHGFEHSNEGDDKEHEQVAATFETSSVPHTEKEVKAETTVSPATQPYATSSHEPEGVSEEHEHQEEHEQHEHVTPIITLISTQTHTTIQEPVQETSAHEDDNIQEEYHPLQLPVTTTTTTETPVTYGNVNEVIPLSTEKDLKEEEEQSTEIKDVNEPEQATTGLVDSHSHSEEDTGLQTSVHVITTTAQSISETTTHSQSPMYWENETNQPIQETSLPSRTESVNEHQEEEEQEEENTSTHVLYTTSTPIHEESEEEEEKHVATEVHLPVANESYSSERTEPANVSHALEETESAVETTTEPRIQTPKPFETEESEHGNNETSVSHATSFEQITTASSVAESVTVNPTTTENLISIHSSLPHQLIENYTTTSPVVTVSESVSVTNTYNEMDNASDSDRQPKFDITLGHTPVEPEMEYHTHDHEDEDERETIPFMHQEVQLVTTDRIKTEEATISSVEEQSSHTENSSLPFGLVHKEENNSMMAINETDGVLTTTFTPYTSEESLFVHHTSPPSFLESSEEEDETQSTLMEDSNESSSTALSASSEEMKVEPTQTTTSSEMELTSFQETSTSTEYTFSGRSFESNHPALFANDHNNVTYLEDNSTMSKQININETLHRPLSTFENDNLNGEDERQEFTTSTVAPRLDNDEKNVTNPLDPNVTDVALGVLPLEEDKSGRSQNSSRSTDNTEINTTTNTNETENTSVPEMIADDHNTISSTTYSIAAVENSTQESTNNTSPTEKPLNDTDIEVHKWEDTTTTVSNVSEEYNQKNESSTVSFENLTTENDINDEEQSTSLSLFNAVEPITLKYEQSTNLSSNENAVNESAAEPSHLMETSNGTNENNDTTISQLESYVNGTNEIHTNNATSNSDEDLIAMETTTTSLQKPKMFSNVPVEESTMNNNETVANYSSISEAPDSSKTIPEPKENETSTESHSFGDDMLITTASHNETSHLYEVHEVTDDITTPTPTRTFNYSPLPVIPLTDSEPIENEKINIESDNLYSSNLNDISDEKEKYSSKYYYSDKKKEFSKTVDAPTTESIQGSNNTDQEEDHLIATDFVSHITITDKPNNATIAPINNLSSTQTTNTIIESTEPVYNVTSEVKPVVEGYTLSSFSRCSAGQFQCVNGTSTKGGSYCVSNSDRCDSVKDCTDGSDEVGCDQENCKDNFQCKSGQCLKRHLVCDGIFNCDDNSDEENCESWKCNFDELSCGDGKRCIPLSWKCDGKSHCFDGRDEQNCHSQPCESNHFYCSEQDSCIPASWRCDGVDDCKSGEDEKLCECGIDQFKCQTGGGCIQAENRCDGIEQCPDLSDEWNCLRLRETNDTSSYLEALVSNNSWQPICADFWNTTYSDLACQSMGYAKATSTNYKLLEKSSSGSQFLKLNPSERYGASLSAQLIKTDSCDNVVTLTCQENVCGNNNGLDTSSFGSKNENGNEKGWPSIALLFNRRYQIQCTANIVTPNWVIASYACLYSVSGQPPSSNPYDWELLAGGNHFFDSSAENSSIQSLSVKNIIPYPQAKYSQFIYRNNIALVQLMKPLDFEKNISAVCLPPQNEEPNQYCITVGWSMKKPGESSLKEYLRYLPDLNQNKRDCNSSDHYNGRFTTDLLCVDHLTTDEPCEDDQGAPLMCFSESSQNWELRGLLSLDGNCQKFHRPSLFTSTSGEIGTWIENTIGTKPKPFNNKLQ
ncbi:uncharacterized protein LOC108734135 [Agrilus planipennis]|uniref:Uncharacterized protein LOC108734135 n=1 Tax=Agrilus planipennis TaxID=224129 RepID=A0A1W4WAL0_AGRPL|nr:uncharacterized protein LOC108734135 [Agrilus planipennis]